ncbi:hypothetical protein XA68_15618 [Ophiocordyceps unilateralis]|uniref:LysM domain-containing protein n=1 Tax=Ophiocordyceps unilateralis TaxID=268505 RepID=A0A2A9P808_OPHUN|nr:hypothetical protein XA68_15618 [Ophiocordyceps unilateralis]
MASLMKSCLILLGGYSALAAAAPQDRPTAGSEPELCDHTVKLGEYCYLIAGTYGVNVTDLRRWNTQLDDDCSLKPQDVLKVPCVQARAATPKMDGPCTKFYTTVEGDTCYSIATCEAVGPKNLIAWNKLDENCSLKVNQELCVSLYEPVKCEKYHRVKKEDTCEKIAQKIGKDLSYLVGLNPALLFPDCFLDIGYKVCIEAESKAVPAVPEPAVSASASAEAAAPAVVTTVPVPHWPLNRTATSFVTAIITKSSTSPAASSNAMASSPSNFTVNISQELMVRIRMILGRYVGNHTGSEPISDSVLLPPKTQVEEMIKEAAKVKSDSQGAGPVPGSNEVDAVSPPAAPASQSIVCNQIFNVFASTSVNIQNSGCATGTCSLQVSSNANAGFHWSPASSAYSAGNAPVAVGSQQQQNAAGVSASVKAEEEVDHILPPYEEEEGACEAE